MNLRSSSSAYTPDEETMSFKFKKRSNSLYESNKQSCPQDGILQIKKYKTLPTDFSSLSLNDAESVKSLSFSQISDDCRSEFGNSISPSDCDELLSLDTISIYSDSTYDNDRDDAYSDITYQSSIHRPVKRRKFTNLSDVSSEQLSCFSGNDSDRLTVNSLKRNLESEKPTDNCSSSDFKTTEKSFQRWNCKKWFASVALFTMLICILLLLSMTLCSNQNKELFPLENLKTNLTTCLVGHEYSVPLITDLLDKFITNYYNKDIHLAWIVGGIGVGKSYTRYLIKSSLASHVTQQSVLTSLIPDHNVSVEDTVDNLIKNLDKCKSNIIFVDGYDNENDVTLELIKVLVSKLNNQKSVWSISRQVLIFIFGTHKSSIINSHYLHYLKDFGSNREHFNFEEIQMTMYNLSPFNFLNEYPHYFSVVPLLPLDVSHLKKCVISQLNFISKKSSCNTNLDKDLENFLKQRNYTVEEIQKEVISLSKIQPSKTMNLVPAGCKRVYQIVSSLLYFPLSIHSGSG
ncbi:UNVERIFIED_CONTAM: hypothetical protein RMT77_012602 [Armadillidium vulgare]